MSATTKIEWCDATFNPWTGCTKWGPDCDNCYAASFSLRVGGPDYRKGVPRRRCNGFEKSALALARKAAKLGKRLKVFPSLCDVFDAEVPPEWRADFWRVVDATRDRLDWLILTKRTENVAGMLPEGWGDGWAGVWLGMSAGDQKTFDRRVGAFMAVPVSAVRFLSYEPAFGPVDLRGSLGGRWDTRLDGSMDFGDGYNMATIWPSNAEAKWSTWGRNGSEVEHGTCHTVFGAKSAVERSIAKSGQFGRFDWAIIGGESGPGARPFNLKWARDVLAQCKRAKVTAFYKQGGASNACQHEAKGGCVECMPADLRVREWPRVTDGAA